MDGIDNTGVFANDSKIDQAAYAIYKLQVLANDLTDPRLSQQNNGFNKVNAIFFNLNFRFDQANKLIEAKYEEIEKKLIEKFHSAFYANERKAMKTYISILSNFKGYQQCVNEFIKNCQSVRFIFFC